LCLAISVKRDEQPYSKTHIKKDVLLDYWMMQRMSSFFEWLLSLGPFQSVAVLAICAVLTGAHDVEMPY
jgi:hypothetical protein